MSARKTRALDFAILGGEPAFTGDLPVGQLYFPSWERYESAMRSIFEQRHYTNDGPMVQELEERLAAFFGTRHVLAVSNATAGLYLLAKALVGEGKVMIPAFTFIATAQAMSWAGLELAFCDVEPETHQVSATCADRAWEEDVCALVAVNLWGGSCDPAALETWAQRRGCQLFFDSAQAFGCATESGPIGRFGTAEVFSFHATKIVSCGEGGCISTDDDALAERIRNMRNDYGNRVTCPVPLSINACMSEAQAAVALMSFDDLESHRAHNQRLRRVYESSLNAVPGFRVLPPSSVRISNSQYLVCEVESEAFGMSRDRLLSVLKAEGVAARRYVYPGAHRTPPYAATHAQYCDALPATDVICEKVLQLPVGSLVTAGAAERVSQLVNDAHVFAAALRGPRKDGSPVAAAGASLPQLH